MSNLREFCVQFLLTSALPPKGTVKRFFEGNSDAGERHSAIAEAMANTESRMQNDSAAAGIVLRT